MYLPGCTQLTQLMRCASHCEQEMQTADTKHVFGHGYALPKRLVGVVVVVELLWYQPVNAAIFVYMCMSLC